MNLQLHFAQNFFKKSLKLAEIDLFHSNAKIVFFSEKKPKSGKSRPHALRIVIFENYSQPKIELKNDARVEKVLASSPKTPEVLRPAPPPRTPKHAHCA